MDEAQASDSFAEIDTKTTSGARAYDCLTEGKVRLCTPHSGVQAESQAPDLLCMHEAPAPLGIGGFVVSGLVLEGLREP
jgi:hypothetical protein